MKKLIAFLCALVFLLGMAGCSESMHSVSKDEPAVSGTVEEAVASFRAKVLEVNADSLLVAPLSGSNESKTADRIEVSLAEKTSWPIPAVGDTVHVFYSGGIQETYPVRIARVHRVEIEMSKPNDAELAPDTEIPGATLHIVEIRDRAREENLPCDTAFEKFYEDGNTEYYFSCIKSHYIMVMDNTGRTVDIVTALNEGLATIEDLDHYGIEYFAEPKEDALDAVISKAVLDHYRSDQPDGLIHAESHVLLAKETVSGTPRAGENNHVEKTVAYLLAYHAKYSTYSGELKAVSDSCVPAAITFRVDGSGEYIPEEYWEPRDGYYTKDIRSKFPGAAADDALNHQTYAEDLKAQTYDKALAYLNSIGNPNVNGAG